MGNVDNVDNIHTYIVFIWTLHSHIYIVSIVHFGFNTLYIQNINV